jgi:TolA-binding protein
MKVDPYMKNSFPLPDMHAVDVQKLSELRIDALETEIAELNCKRKEMETEVLLRDFTCILFTQPAIKIGHMREKIATRDDEIHRLGGLLELKSREAPDIVTDSNNKSFSSNRQYQLERQLDYFHDKVEDLTSVSYNPNVVYS